MILFGLVQLADNGSFLFLNLFCRRTCRRSEIEFELSLRTHRSQLLVQAANEGHTH